MNKRIYLDHSATTGTKQEVLEEMLPVFTTNYGNPSSVHSFGRDAKKLVDQARMRVAKALGALPEEIFFTAGGTEADNWVLKGVAYANKNKGNHIITTGIEHHAVINTCKYLEEHGFKVTFLPVNEYGIVNLDEIEKSIADNTILISVMFANNEIGTIEPIKEIGSLCRKKGILFHTDAVQAVGNVPIDVKDMNIDLLSIASHKFYGPKGMGALYIRKGVKIDSLIHGGAQERGRRAGTENIPGIVGMGKAIEIAVKNMDSESKRLIYLRDKLIEGLLKISGTKLNGDKNNRLPGNVNVTFDSVDGEILAMALDEDGICVSNGSACSAGAIEPSHVLTAIGLSRDAAKGSLRLTIGANTTEDEVDFVVNAIDNTVVKLRENNKRWQQIQD